MGASFAVSARKTALLLALWCASWSGAARAAETGEARPEIDLAIARVESAQAAFSTCVEDRRSLSATSVSSSPRIAAGIVVADPELKKEFWSELIVRQTCRALAGGTPAPCADLAGLPGDPESGEHVCNRLYRMALFSKALIGKTGDASSACARWCEWAPSRPPADVVARVCAALVGDQDYHVACGSIATWRKLGPGYVERECAWEMRSLLGAGEEESCRKSYHSGNEHTPGGELCVATVRLKGGDCGDDVLCRAMRGDGGDVCAALDANIESKASPLFSKGLTAGGRVARLDADCAVIRTDAENAVDAARRRLQAPGTVRDASWRSRRGELERLEERQRSLEAADLAARR